MKRILPYLSLIFLVSCSNKNAEKNQNQVDTEVSTYDIRINSPLEEKKQDLTSLGFQEIGNLFEKKEENIHISVNLSGNTDINSYTIIWEGDTENINTFTKRFINDLKRQHPDLQESNGYFATRYLEGNEEIILELITSPKKVELSHRKNH